MFSLSLSLSLSLLLSHFFLAHVSFSFCIGIMAKGELMCLGSASHLEAKFGLGYVLSLNFHENDQETVAKFVKENFPRAELDATYRGNMQFSLDQSMKVSEVRAAKKRKKEKHREETCVCVCVCV
jgi:hypothetical protein